MSVYVDDMMAPFRGMLMNHLCADTVDELHEFAAKLGLKRAWFQNKRVPHYDVSKGVREKAIRLGAIPVEFGREPFRCAGCHHLTLPCVKRMRCECVGASV